MAEKIKKNKKILIAAIAVFIVFIFAAGTKPVLGIIHDSITNLIIIWPLNMVRLGLAGLLAILGDALNWSISGLSSFTGESFVQNGAKISRDVANMFLTLILIIISFATIFQYESYNAKKLLPRLITVALLINFSLVIAGGIINVSNMFSTLFINMAKGTSENISAQIMNGAGMAYTKVMNDATKKSKNETPEATSFKGIMFQIIFLFIEIFVVGAAFVLMLIRTIYLWILLILSPLAFAAWILPSMKKHWDNWWTNFLKWTMFAPVFTFFLALAVLNIGAMSNSFPKNSYTSFGFDVFTSSLKTIMQFFVFNALVMAGLMAGQSMGIKGADTAQTWSKRLAKGAAIGAGGLAAGVVAGVGGGVVGGIRGYSKKETWKGIGKGTVAGFKKGRFFPETAAGWAVGAKELFERKVLQKEARKEAFEKARRRVGKSKADAFKDSYNLVKDKFKDKDDDDINNMIAKGALDDKNRSEAERAFIAMRGAKKLTAQMAEKYFDILNAVGMGKSFLKSLQEGGRADLSVWLGEKVKNPSLLLNDPAIKAKIEESLAFMDNAVLLKQQDSVLNSYFPGAVQQMTAKRISTLAGAANKVIATIAQQAI